MELVSRLGILSEKLGKINSDSVARKRINKLFDEGSFIELDAFAKTDGCGAGVVTGYGMINGTPTYVFSQDIEINSGAVDMTHAEKIKKVYDMATTTGVPVIGIYDSNGAKLDDVPAALNAYGEMLLSSNKISGIVPQISLILGTCAGSSAMVACGADFVIMSKQAEFFLNSPKVASLNGVGADEAGSADSTAKSGVAHLVAEDEDIAIEQARALITKLPQNNLSSVTENEFIAPTPGVKQLRNICEKIEETEFENISKYIFDKDSCIVLNSDFGKNATVGLASVCGITVLFVSAEKTLGIDECNKISYFVNFADSFSIPVVTFVNTDGFSPSSQDELAGLIRHTSKVSHVYAQSTTQKITIVTGKAYGSAYITLAGKNASADFVYAWPSAIISALYPTTAVAFLAGDRINSENSRQDVEENYKITDASPFVYAERGYIDRVIDPADTRNAIISSLDILSGKRIQSLAKKHSNMPL